MSMTKRPRDNSTTSETTSLDPHVETLLDKAYFSSSSTSSYTITSSRDDDAFETFVRRMPKVELHVHIEGTLEPEMAFRLAARNGIKLKYETVEAMRAAALDFDGLQAFLDLYYEACGVLKTEEDFYELAMAYFDRVVGGENLLHAEIFFDPQTHAANGVTYGTVLRGLVRAKETALRKYPSFRSVAYICCFLRHLSEDEAMRTLETALVNPQTKRAVVGFGLDSGERVNPPEKFANVFRRCREEGFHVVAHAGEEAGAPSVRGALDALGAERLDHGVRVMEEAKLVERCRALQVPFTVCPLSNVRLRVFPSLSESHLPAMLESGLRATINSDDPAYFGGYITENYVAAFRAFPGRWKTSLLWTLARNAVEASFLSSSEKREMLNEVRNFFVVNAAAIEENGTTTAADDNVT